jgi:predicted DNA-binding transcriptional regulator YafY
MVSRKSPAEKAPPPPFTKEAGRGHTRSVRADRLLGILMFLLDKGKATAAELSKRFEASERTIYRDMTALSTAGFPVTSLSGPGGGFTMTEGYVLDRSFLTPSEVLSLLGALDAVGEAARGSGLEMALEKFRAISTKGKPSREALPPPIVVSLSPWGGRASGERKVELLREAIEKRRVIAFSYSGLRGPSGRREAEPFTLALGGSVWYLHAFCKLRKEFRLFRLSRMDGLETLGERFDPRKRLPVPPPWSANWGDGPLMAIVLEFSKENRMAVLDSFPAEEISETEEGLLRVSFAWPQAEPPVRFILGFGPGTRVVSPESLRETVKEAAAALALGNAPGGGIPEGT